ncbi:DoxX family protein [Geitlerinema sp. PCC 7407]|uniref:DoxX family protein n=1 Tax=Geitlerinema sp. PCC 7407 TaxID=1173025 RepID=UPI00029FC0ED|nr:DoxX family protein [Geitlerinema sp. PCC 7407]AFY67782.1 DoxX family protein [Geitlerinema sp. PCC 7407]
MPESTLRNLITLLGRLLLSAIFLRSAIGKMSDPGGTIEAMASVGIPLPNLLLIPTILLLIGGGLSVLLGYKAQWGAIALILFLIPATLLFHTDFSQAGQDIQFMKNLAILGGLLIMTQYGSGPLSLDTSLKKAQAEHP